VGGTVFSTGGAAASSVLSQLRASVLQKSVVRSHHFVAGFGAAILAATQSCYGGDVSAATRGMTRLADRTEPRPAEFEQYETIYELFRAACARRGYD
jgi:sugar (pentulose or hexulose) kinase